MTLQPYCQLGGSLRMPSQFWKLRIFLFLPLPFFFFGPLVQLCIFILISNEEIELLWTPRKMYIVRCFLWMNSSLIYKLILYLKVGHFR